MQFDASSFGFLQIDGVAYDHDVVIDGGEFAPQEEAVEEIPGAIRPHAPVRQEGDTLEM